MFSTPGGTLAVRIEESVSLLARVLRVTRMLRDTVHDPLTHQIRRPLQARQRDIALRIENAVHLRPAGLEQNSHARLGKLFLLHSLRQLPGDDLLRWLAPALPRR